MSDFAPYNPERAALAAGLNNSGSICYLNSLLQALASCTSLRDIALRLRAAPHEPQLTPVGRALVEALVPETFDAEAGTRVAAALQAAAAKRADGGEVLGQSGMGNQCAHEGLVLLLQAAWRDDEHETRAAGRADRSNPLLKPFIATQRAGLYDANYTLLGTPVEQDITVQELFGLAAHDPITSAEDPGSFAGYLRRHVEMIDDCPALPEYGNRAPAWRLYQLSAAAEIIVVAFNCWGNKRAAHWFPESFVFPGRDDGTDRPAGPRYRLVAQVEHSGTRNGGHYWGRYLRRVEDTGGFSGEPLEVEGHYINDGQVGGIRFFAPAESTYLLFYHWTL